jgi:hypothetical protein
LIKQSALEGYYSRFFTEGENSMGVDSGNPVELELMEQTGLTTASTSGMIQTGGDKGKRKNLQCSICLEISMLRALAGD